MAKSRSAGAGTGRSPRQPRQPIPVAPGGPRPFSRRWFAEHWGELRKVQWPTRAQLAQGTLVVGIVTLFFAFYLTAVDFIVARVAEYILPV